MDMDQDSLQINLKSSFKEVFKSGAEGNLKDNIARSLAIGAFIEKRVTLARAAELAEISLVEFIGILSKYNISWMEYTEETFKEDQETLERLRIIQQSKNINKEDYLKIEDYIFSGMTIDQIYENAKKHWEDIK